MIGRILQAFINVFRFHKFKLFVLLVFTMIFVLLIFPYSDLGDLVSAKVSELTQNQVYVQFEDLSLNLFPQPGLEMENVFVETPYFPPLTVRSLSISPSIVGLLSFKPGVSLYARGFFGGRLSLSTRGGDKTENGVRRQIIDLSVDNLDLAKLAMVAQMPLPLKGVINLDSQGQIDPSFGEQPSGNLQIEINNFEIVSSTVPTKFGPVNVPPIRVGHVTLSGQLGDGRFAIDDGRVGEGTKDLHGTVKGNLNFRIDKMGQQPVFNMAGYDLDIDITASNGLASNPNAKMFLGLLDSYRQVTPDGPRYQLKVSSSGCPTPPCMLALGQ